MLDLNFDFKAADYRFVNRFMSLTVPRTPNPEGIVDPEQILAEHACLTVFIGNCHSPLSLRAVFYWSTQPTMPMGSVDYCELHKL